MDHFHKMLPLQTIATSNTMHNLMSPKMTGFKRVNSPMTNLTQNLRELTTEGETPRRKLSLSNIETPNSSNKEVSVPIFSTKLGCFLESPMQINSPTLSDRSQCIPLGLRRFNSMPLSRLNINISPESETIHSSHQSTPQALSCSVRSPGLQDSDSGSDKENLSDSGGSSLGSDGQRDLRVAYLSEESCSQDSGLEADRGSDSRDSKDQDDGFMFAAPKGLPRRRQVKLISEETCSPFKYSPVKNCSPSKVHSSCRKGSLDFSGEFTKPAGEEGDDSPLKLCRLTSLDEGLGGEDGFLDLMDAEVAALTAPPTSAMARLFNAPVINRQTGLTAATHDDDNTPVTRRVKSRRNISRHMSVDVGRRRPSLKRDLPDGDDSPMQLSLKHPQDESTPKQQQKRHRPSSVTESPTSTVSKPMLHRCHSESEAMIKSALARQADEPDLVGDCSRTYCLPTFKGKHDDLKSISGETLSHVLEGRYYEDIEQAIIVDCRYPYEFDGGHIQGAKNIYSSEQIIHEFLKTPLVPCDPTKRIVLVFHCEFSSERGPRLSRFLRSQDRMMNKDCYPHLHYPEIYLLEGGYKAYFETEKHFCEPPMYKPMLHKDHAEDLRHFRAKSKSWAGEQRCTRPGFRPLKF
ncbi:M-phase inducer phosphatase 1-like isoform X2 [Dreissena polymorpha]|uniref:M-phase inducer phosphatase 1-like isoform X2 n=1 Tax=Dreissena polymorpha TaxID=45954 RepID=UPI002263DC20|nr:M-phase inducer phosphatase 1-like isoform X2 [Dreissena polymorpha]